VAKSNSAKKRIIVNERNRLLNRSYKSNIKTIIKRYFALVDSYNKFENENSKQSREEILNQLFEVYNKAYSIIDKANKKNIIQKNKAARKKSQIAKALNKIKK